jgi:hypothetical protein
MSLAVNIPVCASLDTLPLHHSLISPEQGSTLVCGVNSTEDLIKQGQNENCRVFSLKDNQYAR